MYDVLIWRITFPLSQRICFIDCRKTTDLIMCYSTQRQSPFRVQKLFYIQEFLISIPVLQSVNLRDASLGAFAKFRKTTISFFSFFSRRPSAWNSLPLDGFFMEFEI